MNLDAQNTDALALHLREAVASATLVTDPGPHMVISDLLPAAVYARLLDAMPPPEAFEVADRVKANFDPLRATNAPEPSREAWSGFHNDIVDGLLKPLLLESFRPFLVTCYRALFGPELGDEALAFRHHALSGRLMLRRPGYRLKPHRDMKIAALTGLIYFARPGDSHEYGTELYRIENDRQALFMKTYYPEAHGARAELVRTVPSVANSALIFMNVPAWRMEQVFRPTPSSPSGTLTSSTSDRRSPRWLASSGDCHRSRLRRGPTSPIPTGNTDILSHHSGRVRSRSVGSRRSANIA